MKHDLKLIIEIIDEAIRLLPVVERDVPSFKGIKNFSPQTTITKAPRKLPSFNAYKVRA